ncbi:MAG TPA: hypothetical protein VK029_09960 [Pseudogracilibacillus sp.]|nr:hypothetical protein [Pseudogracilibacillus sp.]
MLTEREIITFLEQHDYDIRENNNGRWIDQKCTPDVVNIVSDCVIQYTSDDGNEEFTSVDIWRSPYAEEFVRDIFNKPSTQSELSRNEYDKFFAQPLELLANAEVLHKTKRGNRNYYRVQNEDILEYISLRERNSLLFIKEYCEKVLRDSDIWEPFENFFTIQTKEAYYSLKERFENFIIAHTPINGVTEVRRIFTKIVNPLAYARQKRGTSRGRISKYAITYAELMYNRENFRDLHADKPKGVTRNEWKEERKQEMNLNYFKYQSLKAKRFLKSYNDEYRARASEYDDEFSIGEATHIHHIFPESEFPEISGHYENLIALTPTQHLTKAHPANNTHRIDAAYQEQLLKAKARIIEENINDPQAEKIYSFANFVEVLNTGFNTDYVVEENDFAKVNEIISRFYEQN